MKRIVITGGCGFIGGNLIAYLQQRGNFDVVVYDNESLGKYEFIRDLDVTFVRGDILDKPLLLDTLQGADAVVHLAADTRVIDSIENPQHNFTSNVEGTFNLLTCMREAGVKVVVNASTGGAIIGEATPPINEEMMPSPTSPYGASKMAVEGYLSAFSGAYGFSALSLRFSNVYGPRSFHKGSVVAAFYKRMLEKEALVVYGDGSQKRDYIYIDDLCEGIWKAMTSGRSGVYQLGSGAPTSINELIAFMKNVAGDEFDVPVQYEEFRQGEILHTWCDVSKAKQELGFAPETSLQDGLTKTWNWFLESNKG